MWSGECQPDNRVWALAPDADGARARPHPRGRDFRGDIGAAGSPREEPVGALARNLARPVHHLSVETRLCAYVPRMFLLMEQHDLFPSPYQPVAEEEVARVLTAAI